jgi:hypothetical protein
MVRKTMKMLVVALIAAFALSSSMAEAATPKKTRHRVKHSSRVASGAAAMTARKPAAPQRKKAPAAKSTTRAKASASTAARKPAAKKAPAPRRPTTKPR